MGRQKRHLSKKVIYEDVKFGLNFKEAKQGLKKQRYFRYRKTKDFEAIRHTLRNLSGKV